MVLDVFTVRSEEYKRCRSGAGRILDLRRRTHPCALNSEEGRGRNLRPCARIGRKRERQQCKMSHFHSGAQHSKLSGFGPLRTESNRSRRRAEVRCGSRRVQPQVGRRFATLRRFDTPKSVVADERGEGLRRCALKGCFAALNVVPADADQYDVAYSGQRFGVSCERFDDAPLYRLFELR